MLHVSPSEELLRNRIKIIPTAKSPCLSGQSVRRVDIWIERLCKHYRCDCCGTVVTLFSSVREVFYVANCLTGSRRVCSIREQCSFLNGSDYSQRLCDMESFLYHLESNIVVYGKSTEYHTRVCNMTSDLFLIQWGLESLCKGCRLQYASEPLIVRF